MGIEVKCKFVILCEKRTGSHLLKSLLNSHPNFLCEGELLNNFVRSDFSSSYQHRVARDDLNSSFDAILKRKHKDKVYSAKNVGFLLHGEHINDNLLEMFRETKGLKFIILIRQNLLARLISIKIARTRKVFTSTEEPNIDLLPTFNISPEEFSSSARQIISRNIPPCVRIVVASTEPKKARQGAV